ncbi:MAG: 50S ribosomal protein L28 [Ktedonobacterales bacterium]
MAARCEVCRRKPQYGHKVSHSTRRTNRRFLVNTQHRRLEIDGVMRNVYVCTRCLRTMVKVRKTR